MRTRQTGREATCVESGRKKAKVLRECREWEVAWLKTKAEEANELVHRPNASMVFKVVKELTKGIPRKRTDGGTLQGMNQREVETWKEHFQTIQSGRGEVSEDVWEDMEQ